ncbi:MAG: ABC transporter substrate-binding protein [Candidatus Heimdallarchaeota archaeon]|nr:ABC transporter substrate-binding protein [Candidatus Heimdallarchaeota archaeon]
MEKIQMNGKYRIALVIIGIFAITLLSGCVGTETHDTLILQIEEEIIDLDNRYYGSSSLYDSVVAYQYQGYLGLIAPGETIVTMPGVAESWESNEDQSEWTFNLREGLTFHDGTPIDAKAVRYSFYADFMVYYGLNNVSEGELYLNTYFGMNITFPDADPNGDGYVVNFHGGWYPDPMFLFDVCGQWNIFTLIPYNSHGSYTDSTEVCQDKLADFQDNPVSCGPYKFVEYATQDYVLMERFDDWFGWGETFTGSNGETYTFPTLSKAFKYLKFRIIPEKAMALVELATNGIDVTTGRFSSQASFEEINETEGFSAYKLPVLGGATMEVNLQGDWPAVFGGPGNYPLSESWFRQAVSHAVDRTNIVDNVYLGIADERNTIFSDWILDKFSNIDVSDYYDFDQGRNKSLDILAANDMTALGFSDEPDNILGWGLYANETDINGVPQTKGRHLTLTTMDCDFCVKRALAVQKDLRQIGIYIDPELLEWGQYLTKLYAGTPGQNYNTTGPQPDPNFIGPAWDFTVGGFGGNYETPWDFIAYQSFATWMQYGRGGYSWLNMNYEKGYRMATGFAISSRLSGFPDYDSTVWPVPEWSNDDEQFIEGCELAGYEMSYAMNKIPLVWYVDTYAFNDHLHNFLGARNSMYHAAYAYWE